MAERACEPHSVREKMRGFSSFRMKDVCGTLCILFSFRLDSATTFLCSPRQPSTDFLTVTLHHFRLRLLEENCKSYFLELTFVHYLKKPLAFA